MTNSNSSATAAVQNKEIRKCSCSSRMNTGSLIYDFHSVRIASRGCVCDFDKRCVGHRDVSNGVMEAYFKHQNLIK